MGRWWHKGEEIDIVALNKETREIAIFECKWSRVDEKRAERILDSLKNKAPLLKWYNGKRKEYYGVVGKTIEGKENLREKGYLVFDLKDLESVSF
ncbi:hypothetical protein AKJ43_03535 [candidate division MSBL1 archaeon SCGC-AAA261D19]|uniref:DUF234 domain-containing protein n=1 Tax=candidate division MSBL1 archaeon SCGC-AAA261D19 TaxID=1698273 RepID=A0A133V475_9EURY|nr:hypothetical protein AKJ43_03535 [candidate division MSBL1 archaeon SCGC-AAA261D19]